MVIDDEAGSVVIEPTAHQLADIALSAADSCTTVLLAMSPSLCTSWVLSWSASVSVDVSASVSVRLCCTG